MHNYLKYQIFIHPQDPKMSSYPAQQVEADVGQPGIPE